VIFAVIAAMLNAYRTVTAMRIAAVDLITNTCFPVLTADELGLFKAEGVEVEIELLPMLRATRALRAGAVDAMIAGSVYDLLTEFPGWNGAKIVMAVSQGTPWLLVVRADLAAKRGDINAVKGLRLTAAEGPDHTLKQMLIRAGIDPKRDLELVDLPGVNDPGVSFGVFAAKALAEAKIDGFWANAMGAETVVSRGIGKILIDVRRGDDPGDARHFTFAAFATTEAYIQRQTASVEAAVRAVIKAQKALRAEPSLARKVGQSKFPPDAAALIARTIERDVMFYDPVVSEQAIAGLNGFAQAIGYLSGPVPYEQVVDVRFRKLWTQ
jgi:ABC-type nitrate/sulfonate/bicarbonate transport system substrate-binding protein